MRGRDAVEAIADVDSFFFRAEWRASKACMHDRDDFGHQRHPMTPRPMLSRARSRRPLLPAPNPGASAGRAIPSNSSTAILPLVLLWLSDPDLTAVFSVKSSLDNIILGNGELFLRTAVRPRCADSEDQSNTCSTLLRLSI